MNTKRFHIGSCVSTSKTIEVFSDNGYRSLHKKNHMEPLVGKITGLKRFYLGKIETPINYFDDYSYEPGYLQVTETILCWEIRTGKLNKPLYVLDEDIVSAWGPNHLPLFKIRPYKWTEKDKQVLREEMKNMPRDSKGRWMKITPAKKV